MFYIPILDMHIAWVARIKFFFFFFYNYKTRLVISFHSEISSMEYQLLNICVH